MRYYGFVGSRDLSQEGLAQVRRAIALIAFGQEQKDPNYPDEDYAEVARNITIVSGGARGADREAEFSALERGMHVVSYRPREDEKTGLFLIDVWEDGKFSHQDGRVFSKFATAALFRNGLIVKSIEELFVFWDGVSTGTLNSKQQAHERGIPVNVWVQEPADANA